MGRWARKPVNHTSWVALVTPTDRPKSVRNRCLIELFLWRCLCCHFALFDIFCWCRGFCHRTESDIFLFLLHMFYLLRPILFPNLTLFFRTMLFEYPSVLSHFCLDINIKCTGNNIHTNVHDKHDDFRFPKVNFPWLSGEVPRLPS